MCGFANVQEIQMLSMKYREYITKNFPAEPRNKVILIRRSGSRRFTEQEKIEKVVEAAARMHNLSYVMFIDNPVPSLNDTMRMFHSAVMVVAPHGAGLANVVFSQPGTYICYRRRLQSSTREPLFPATFLRIRSSLARNSISWWL